VSVAQDGEEGLMRAEFVQPDLILLDVMMPGIDGFETCRRLKASDGTRDIPVIFMTALADTHDKINGFSAGGVDYITKPFQIEEVLARVTTHLALRSAQKRLAEQNVQLQQEVAMRQRAEEDLQHANTALEEEQKVSERLLLNLLPHPIAERLKARPDLMADSFPEVIADSFPEVTVLFADIVEFTRFSAAMSPERLVARLNEIFTDFDTITDRRGLEKIKTIGDAYMAAAGLPVLAADHAARAAHMALDMMDALASFNERNGYRLQMRIGINSGAVVAGVIGKRKFIYDLWGDTVNTASRMESHGVAGRVQVTEATRRRLGAPFLFEERGIIEAKGMGALHTWFLTGRSSAPSE
jgi:adenylate cyclase